MIKKYYPYILIGLGALIFIITTIILACNSYQPLGVDTAVRDFFYNIRGEKNGFFYYFFRILTECGYVYVIVLLIVVFIILNKGDRQSLVLGIGTLLDWGTNEVVKHIFDRERPIEANRWMVEASSSYPSGHSMTSTFLYLMLIYYINKSSLSKNKKIILTSISGVILLIIYLSRMVLGVHYFTDIIGGIGFGLFFVGIGIVIDRVLENKNFHFIKGIIEKKQKNTQNSTNNA